MNTSLLSNLQELVGVWSCSVFIAGVVALAYYHFSRDLKLCRALRAKLNENLASAFLLASFVIAFFVAPNMAYSGPVPSEVRHLWQYDKYFAALIALVFAADFAFGWFRIRKDVP